MQGSSRKQLWSLALLVAVALLALYFTRSREEVLQKPSGGLRPLSVSVLVHTETDTLLNRSLETEGPLTALSALEQAASIAKLPVGIRQYDFGKLVVSIGGRTAGQGGDWTYRVNGHLIPVSAETCQLSHGDSLAFRFGKGSDDSLATAPN